MPVTAPVLGRSLGERIHEFRAIRGFSLTELGRRAHVSTSQLSRIERGQRSASPMVVANIARVLGVSVSVLHGQPYIHMLQRDHLDALLEPIGSALDSWDIPDEGPFRSLDALETEVRSIVDLRLRTKFAEIAEALPALLIEVAAQTQRYSPGRNRERAFDLQAELGRTAAILAYRLGFIDLARLALSRMAAAAPHSGDPCQVAIERMERSAMTHAQSARSDRGLALMRVALRDLDDDGTPATQAVRGSLFLRGASLAFQAKDKSSSAELLGEARELAHRIGDVYEHALMFGPFGVALAEMGADNDRNDHAAALKKAASMHLPPKCPPTLAAHFHIRKARAQAWMAQHDEALESLSLAKATAPELTRYHPHVHEAVGVMLRARAAVPDTLRKFAQWSGV
ncbi:helix-turn-helix domain-containing protein [Streptomyces specialis]|uniref:helix-turn-helix domain-containing protein n=1 Tax=Streptomyces specialis TaxID=498367 RepID=UPI00073F1171|nr:helix-turn-helix transcriptional regulator [Streptomyces specialis]